MHCLMLDIETFGISVDSVIITVGGVHFNPYDINEDPYDPLYLKLDIDHQCQLGRTIDNSTLEWWNKQPKEILEEAMSEHDRTGLIDFTKQLNRNVAQAKQIWSQGPVFDIVMIENLYRMLNIPYPWSYWQIRDSRTISDLGDSTVKDKNDTAHNALTDAYWQAKTVQSVYHQLGITEPRK